LIRPADVSAAEVLDRAANAVAPGNPSLSYHLVATRADILPSGQTGTTGVEVWFGAGGRYREETRWQDQATVVGTDGSDGWMYLTMQGKTYATRGINLRTQKDLVPSGQSDLAQLLAELSKRVCGPATLVGEATVAGWSSYLVRVSGQAAASCGDPKSASASTSAKSPAQTVAVDMTMAIDKQTFVLLRSEASGPKGTQRYEVSRIEYDPPPAATLFTFTPPAGAAVFDSAAALKQHLVAPGNPKAEKAP
jgi:outer membrane lipoprotein-sorting protein